MYMSSPCRPDRKGDVEGGGVGGGELESFRTTTHRQIEAKELIDSQCLCDVHDGSVNLKVDIPDALGPTRCTSGVFGLRWRLCRCRMLVCALREPVSASLSHGSVLAMALDDLLAQAAG